MGIDENERKQAILDAGARLLLQHGYNKTTMSDVADAVGLNRALIYQHFKSKDELVEALIMRELQGYGKAWIKALEADPQGGTVASLYRVTLQIINENNLRAAIHTRDEQTFGKYLRKPNNLFEQMPDSSYMTRDFLQIMQDAGAVRRDVNINALAVILDALTPALLETLSVRVAEVRGEATSSNRPTADELMTTLAEMLDRMLTPPEGANLEAGKAAFRHMLEVAQTHMNTRIEQQQAEAT
ncbi:hypothetical protein KSF_092880 [Reticulibacter mediterranei]|uniref:HTH tetR-type domain-containing protein n=1 Tax=Reticulibacter mediterranei TaxID=2778369 RepID=A0A8J3IYR1_9CHLR|nr:helix-turn-helix domain-containing protein [Reticulibacter mediterranei]GHO99240.1 hypothetical protein KSF_092880 [Reticulibacter mediterranei]